MVTPRALIPSAAWSWFSDPRAVRHRGLRDRTYLGWITLQGEVQVASLDHVSRALVVTTLAERFQVDDHNSPSVLVRHDGRLQVFWSAHNGNALLYRISTAPESVTQFGPVRVIDASVGPVRKYTYTHPVHLPEDDGGRGRYLLFFRMGYTWPAYVASSDGETWGRACYLVESLPTARPYVKVAQAGADGVVIAFTDGHPRDVENDVYAMRYRQGEFCTVGGEVLGALGGPPVTREQADAVYRHTTAGRAWVQDVAVTPDGRPVVAYSTYPSDADHRYRYAAWQPGLGWADHEVVAAGGTIAPGTSETMYSGGMSLDQADPRVVYLSRQTGPRHQVERWTTLDDGVSFSSEPVAPSASSQVRPVRVRGQDPGDEDFGTFWMSGTYDYFTRFRTALSGTVTGSAPITVRLSAPASVPRGGRARIGVRALVGAGTAPLGGMRVQLLSQQGHRWVVLATHETDATGHTLFLPAVARTTRYRAIVLEGKGFAQTGSVVRTVAVRA